MVSYLLRRLIALVTTVLAVISLVFVLLRLSPGSPLYTLLGFSYSEEGRAAVAERLGLNASIPEQYVRYLRQLAGGDLGASVFSGQPVGELLAQRLPVSLELGLVAGAVWMALGILAGALAALRHGSPFDGLVRVTSVVALSVPSFWLGLVCVLVFGVYITGVLPVSGYVPISEGLPEHLRGLVLPAFVLGLPAFAVVARTFRGSVLEVLDRDYVSFATSMGMSRRTLLARVAMRNAAIPLVTVMGLMLGMLVSGAILVENVFGVPGLGQLMVDSFRRQDYPVAAGCCLAVAVLYLLTNLLVDLAQLAIDPRIREGVLNGGRVR
ncbi:ABC transporter permease [Microtetraspora glauca]|uniref:ABC transporter permease n=1 Tax=Microtetraspora glauca TaxID=1996 RepID=A0ABV3GGR2_MICGL